MTRLTRVLLFTIVGFSLGASVTTDVFAARMGGGKSFGSRPSYSQPYRAPSGSQGASPSQARPAYQNPAYARNQAARDTMSRRGGLMGMLGGLALGGILGSMLFGGAFEHINLMDILVFAGIAFLLFKLFAARRAANPRLTPTGSQNYGSTSGDSEYNRYQRSGTAPTPAGGPAAEFDTDVLFKGGNRSVGSAGSIYSSERVTSIPADFDSENFLSGAKVAYGHLQAAWDRADLTELRELTTDKVFGELQEQLREREGENRTELLRVDCSLLDVRDSAGDREASVLFKVLMKESADASPTEISEVWHFTRSRSSRQPTWFLDGIQQTDA